MNLLASSTGTVVDESVAMPARTTREHGEGEIRRTHGKEPLDGIVRVRTNVAAIAKMHDQFVSQLVTYQEPERLNMKRLTEVTNIHTLHEQNQWNEESQSFLRITFRRRYSNQKKR